MNKRYEILDGLPSYGEMAIPILDGDDIFVSEGYVVKFYRDDGTTWIANFPKGYTNLFSVIEFSNNDNLFIISGGEAYLMNPNYSKPIKDFYYSVEEFVKNDNGGLIIATLTDIIFFDEYAEEEWRINISFDGIKNLKLDNNTLTGYCYDIFITDGSDSWQPFFINLDTKEVAGGCSQPEILKEKKPWYRYVWVGSVILLLYYQLSK